MAVWSGFTPTKPEQENLQQLPGVHVISALPLPQEMMALALFQAVLHCQGNGIAKHDLQQRAHRQTGQPGVVQAKPGCQVVEMLVGARSAGHRVCLRATQCSLYGPFMAVQVACDKSEVTLHQTSLSHAWGSLLELHVQS